jgi:hypothetical protein
MAGSGLKEPLAAIDLKKTNTSSSSAQSQGGMTSSQQHTIKKIEQHTQTRQFSKLYQNM